jgi:hypothetical protein
LTTVHTASYSIRTNAQCCSRYDWKRHGKDTAKQSSNCRFERQTVRLYQGKGDAFEREVANVFRDLPNATVQPHLLIGGKDVDIYVVLKMPLSNELKIAVDAKDYGKPLTRDQAAAEIVSY